MRPILASAKYQLDAVHGIGVDGSILGFLIPLMFLSISWFVLYSRWKDKNFFSPAK